MKTVTEKFYFEIPEMPKVIYIPYGIAKDREVNDMPPDPAYILKSEYDELVKIILENTIEIEVGMSPDRLQCRYCGAFNHWREPIHREDCITNRFIK